MSFRSCISMRIITLSFNYLGTEVLFKITFVGGGRSLLFIKVENYWPTKRGRDFGSNMFVLPLSHFDRLLALSES